MDRSSISYKTLNSQKNINTKYPNTDLTPRKNFLVKNNYSSFKSDKSRFFPPENREMTCLLKRKTVAYQPRFVQAGDLYESIPSVEGTPVYLVNPFAIKFSQSSASLKFSEPGVGYRGNVIDTVEDAAADFCECIKSKENKTMPAIRVFVNPGYANGQTVKHGDSFITTTKGREPALYTLDHRTLIAARLAKVNVPVVFVSLTATVRGKELFKLTGKDGNEITLVNGSKEWSITDKYDKYANDLNQLHEKLHNALLKKLQSKELLPATAFTLAKEGDGKPVTEFSLNKIGSGMQKSSLMKAAEEYMNPDFMNDSVLEENFEKSQRHTNSLISTISKKLEIPEKKGRSKTSLLFESPEKTVIIKREDMPGTVSKVTAPNSFLGKPSDSLITKVEPNKVMPEKKLTPLSKLFLEIEKDKIKLQGKPVVKSMQPSKK